MAVSIRAMAEKWSDNSLSTDIYYGIRAFLFMSLSGYYVFFDFIWRAK